MRGGTTTAGMHRGTQAASGAGAGSRSLGPVPLPCPGRGFPGPAAGGTGSRRWGRAGLAVLPMSFPSPPGPEDLERDLGGGKARSRRAGWWGGDCGRCRPRTRRCQARSGKAGELRGSRRSRLSSTAGVLVSPQIPKDPAQRRVRELTMLSKQLQQVHPNVLAKVLKQGTVYQNEEIVVINKPYGLPVHGEEKPHPC